MMSGRRRQCRACLQLSGTLKPLFGRGLRRAQMLAAFAVAPISKDDRLPTHICVSCLADLKVAYRFKQKVESSYNLLLLNVVKAEQETAQLTNNDRIKMEEILETFDANPSHEPYEADDLFDTFDDQLEIKFEENPDDQKIEIKQEDDTPIKSEPDNKDDINTSLHIKNTKKKKNYTINTDKNGSFILAGVDDKGFETGEVRGVKKVYKHRCNFCPRIYSSSSQFKNHVNRHLGLKPYYCEKCGKSFLNEKMHKRYHSDRDESNYTCDTCGRNYNNKTSLRAHIRTHCKDIKMFACPECPKLFNLRCKLNNHQVVHSGKYDFMCQYCSKGFRYFKNMEVHINAVHLKFRPFVCDLCPKGFSQMYNLTIHKRRHEGIKNFKCDLCHWAFVSSSEMLNHRKSVHSTIKKYDCRNCGALFTRSNSRNKHERLNRCILRDNADANHEAMKSRGPPNLIRIERPDFPNLLGFK